MKNNINNNYNNNYNTNKYKNYNIKLIIEDGAELHINNANVITLGQILISKKSTAM